MKQSTDSHCRVGTAPCRHGRIGNIKDLQNIHDLVPYHRLIDGAVIRYLYLMGMDHEKLTYRYAGRDFRLTDVYGYVVKEILAQVQLNLKTAKAKRPKKLCDNPAKPIRSVNSVIQPSGMTVFNENENRWFGLFVRLESLNQEHWEGIIKRP